MKIALIGYGKMGRMIEQIARGRGHEIVSIIDVDNQQDFDSPEFASADVAIEFTAPHVAYGNYLKAFARGVKVVSGSTGWMKDHGDDVRRMCTEEGHTLFWASNFSVGVAIFSAITLAEQITDAIDRKQKWTLGRLTQPDGTTTVEHTPQADEIGISSVRRGEVPGIHTVRYDSDADSITITHDAHSRRGFALGAVLAAEYTATHSGLLTIDDMFKF